MPSQCRGRRGPGPGDATRQQRRALADPLRHHPQQSRSRQSSPSLPSRHPRAGQTIPRPATFIRRLRERHNEVLRLLTDRRVPFDNNQAERDLRMPKLKQKTSGYFHSDTGAGDVAIICSYLSTLCKQFDDLFNSLVLTFQGHPPMPQLE